jgi:hypothetical protein
MTGRAEQIKMRLGAQKMDPSDAADADADNSVTSRMELCIITNLEFTIGTRKRRRNRTWQSPNPAWFAQSLFDDLRRRARTTTTLDGTNIAHHVDIIRYLC